MDNFEFYEEKVGDRVITVCAGEKFYGSNSSDVYIGIAIRHPEKEEREGLGKVISKQRCISAKEPVKRRRNNKMRKVADIRSSLLKNDKFFLQQVAKSSFFRVKHNLDKYIAAL